MKLMNGWISGQSTTRLIRISSDRGVEGNILGLDPRDCTFDSCLSDSENSLEKVDRHLILR